VLGLLIIILRCRFGFTTN